MPRAALHREWAGRSGLLDSLFLLAAAAGGVAGAGVAAWTAYARWYVSVPPNRALVLYGRSAPRPHDDPPLATDGVDVRRARIVVGGGAFVPPWNKGVGRLALDPGSIEVSVRAFSALEGSHASGWEATLQVQVRIPAEPRALARAAESLLGKSDEEVRALVRSMVAAAVPSLLSKLRPEGGEPDWDRLAAEIQAAVAPDLLGWGFLVRTLTVTELRRIVPSEPSGSVPGQRPPTNPGVSWASGRAESELDGPNLRLNRIERSLRVASLAIARLYEETAAAREQGMARSVFDSPLGSEQSLPELSGEGATASLHESREVRRSLPPPSPSPEETGGVEGGGRRISLE